MADQYSGPVTHILQGRLDEDIRSALQGENGLTYAETTSVLMLISLSPTLKSQLTLFFGSKNFLGTAPQLTLNSKGTTKSNNSSYTSKTNTINISTATSENDDIIALRNYYYDNAIDAFAPSDGNTLDEGAYYTNGQTLVDYVVEVLGKEVGHFADRINDLGYGSETPFLSPSNLPAFFNSTGDVTAAFSVEQAAYGLQSEARSALSDVAIDEEMHDNPASKGSAGFGGNPDDGMQPAQPSFEQTWGAAAAPGASLATRNAAVVSIADSIALGARSNGSSKPLLVDLSNGAAWAVNAEQVMLSQTSSGAINAMFVYENGATLPTGDVLPAVNPVTPVNLEAPLSDPENRSQDIIPVLYVNAADGTSTVYDYNPIGSLDGFNVTAVIESYTGQNGTGYVTRIDDETDSQRSGDNVSAITNFFGPNYEFGITVVFSQPDGEGVPLRIDALYQPSLQPQDQQQNHIQNQTQIRSQDNASLTDSEAPTTASYSDIASDLNMPGVTGTVLAALNDDAAPPVLVAGSGNPTYTTSSADSVLAEQASVIVPLASTGPQAIFNAGGTPVGAFIMPVVPAAEQSAVAYAAIVNADARTVTFIAVSAAGDAANMVYVVDNGDNLIDEIPDYAQNLTSGSSLSKQNTQFTGSGYPGMPAYLVAVGNTTIIPSGDFNGSSTTPHAAGDVVGDEVLSGSPYLSLAALNSGAQAASNVFDAGIDSGDDTPDYGYAIGVAAGGGAVITGNGGSGYGGTATLTDVDQVELGGVAYALATVAPGGGATGLTTAPTEPGAGPASSGTIVAEGAGAGSTITLAYDAPVYWHVNAGGDRITLDGAPGDEFYMAGASSQYTPVYNQAAGALDLYAGSGESGTPTVFTIAGTAGGEVNFTDGGVLGLGDVGDATEYVGLGGQANLEDDGNQTIWGGANAEAFFQDGDATPDGSWDIAADNKGDVIFTGADAGYDGTVTLNGFGTRF